MASTEAQLWPTLRQDGQTVFRWAVWEMAKMAKHALEDAGITAEDLVAFIPHQANMRIIDEMVKQLKLPGAVVVARDIADAGNTSAASIPHGHAPDAQGKPRALRRTGPANRLWRRACLRRTGRCPALGLTTRDTTHHSDRTPVVCIVVGLVTGKHRKGAIMASNEEILAGLAEIVNEETGLATEAVEMDKSFTEDLDIDSISMMTIVVNAEEKFDVKIPDEEVKNLKTVGDAVNFIAGAQA